ncbi:phage terminase small subunit [Neobacillus drentensis]|uniref:phage terminase small subunit n=1 Tax=Neobacillus drentensis TaxID=220684 RepID=UPI0028626973|nr:phage terminase small subunit [Neobacillus drentensis]MDR7237134.1 uncharacterized protein YjcR [Neobacillus drentensis]
MARARDPNRDKAHEIWIQHNGEIANREIAKILNVDEKKIAVWKQRDKWNVVQQDIENVVQQNKPIRKKETPKKKKSRGVQKNRSGNPNPQNQFSERNRASFKHGLFSRYIPKETLEIMGMLDKANPIDLLWDQIQIQYAVIIRAQEIMFVQDKEDMTRVLKKQKESDSGWEKEYELQFAWDKHATFMNAQSRAIAELRSSLKQFDDMANADDERRLKLESMQLGVEKTKAEIEKIQGNRDGTEDWITALKEVAEKRKQVKGNE